MDNWERLEIYLLDEIQKVREAAKRRFDTDNEGRDSVNLVMSVDYEKLLHEDIALTNVSKKMYEIEFGRNK